MLLLFQLLPFIMIVAKSYTKTVIVMLASVLLKMSSAIES